MTKFFRLSENAFATISLFFFSQGFFHQIFLRIFLRNNYESSPDQDSLLLRLIFQFIYLITFFLLFFRWRRTFNALKINQWLLFLLILAFISVLWSSVPDIAFRKTVALVGSTFFGIYLGSQYHFERLLKVMGWTYGISIVLSFLFVLLLPQYGVMNRDGIVGAWQGIYLHKNALGENMFISFMTFYFLAKSIKQYRVIFLGASFLSVVLMYFSDSATSLISVLFVYLILQSLKYLSLRYKASILLILIFLILGFLFQLFLVINFNTFLDINNKDITLSGRTILWKFLWDFIKLKFWFGYGYGSFFSVSHPETTLLWRMQDWKPIHSHNGYILLWLNLGIIGFITFILGYFYNLGKALFQYLVSKDFRILWIFSFLIYTVFFNVTEVSFMSINHINWVVSVACIYSLDSILKAHIKNNLEKIKNPKDVIIEKKGRW